MKRLVWTLLAGGVFAAALTSVNANPTPLCRVTATYTPSFGSQFGTLQVSLVDDCPPDGIARIRLGNYGGPGSKATGPTEMLTKQRPSLVWVTQPRYRSVLWEARSGAQYVVQKVVRGK